MWDVRSTCTCDHLCEKWRHHDLLRVEQVACNVVTVVCDVEDETVKTTFLSAWHSTTWTMRRTCSPFIRTASYVRGHVPEQAVSPSQISRIDKSPVSWEVNIPPPPLQFVDLQVIWSLGCYVIVHFCIF